MSLRILMTLDAVGGVWRYAVDLGTALREAGHKVVLAGLGPEPSLAQRAEAAKVGPLHWGAPPLDWMAEDPDALTGVAPWLDGLVDDVKPDLLHLNLPGQAAGRHHGPPCVAVSHSCLATWFRVVQDAPVPDHLAWHADLTRRGLQDAAIAIAPSAAHADLTARTHGVDGIAAVPNASRTPLACPSQGDGTLIAAARWWDPGKGAAVLDAAAGLMDHPVTMLGACRAPDGAEFTARHATTTGALPHARTMARIGAASLFVSPSRYEPFGLAPLEAARLARPLLLADIPVYREIWQGCARFFDPDDPEALAAEARALMADSPARRHLGMVAQERARTFSPRAQARAMEPLYDKALARAAVI